jgi:hypothetical protein
MWSAQKAYTGTILFDKKWQYNPLVNWNKSKLADFLISWSKINIYVAAPDIFSCAQRWIGASAAVYSCW